MQAVILAAGEGQRLRPLTANMPKPLIPVGGKPIMEYIVEALKDNRVEDIIVVVGYKEDMVRQYFGDGKEWGVNIKYVRQKNQIGIANAVLQVENEIDEDFLLIYGDNVIESACVREALNTQPNTILATYSKKAYRYGVVQMEGTKLVKLGDEGGEENIIFTGISHLNREVFSKIREVSTSGDYSFPSVLNSMQINVKVVKCLWMDAIYPWDLLDLNSRALSANVRRLAGKIENATIIGNVEIGDNTVIRAGAYIRGNVTIGENCEIGPNSVILGDTSIGDGVNIGAISYVENSIIMENSRVGEVSVIKDSVIGRDVTAGSRFTALTGKFSRILKDEILRSKGGIVVGDGAEIGSSVVVHPGVLIGANVKIADMKVLTQDICNEERVV
jgi:UDP-N-acetylglucosamine diphosphorylase/glucosamine-1-phosphate N-acetyltransferase